ncbi:uridine diphosphate glucose pyrophosphatase-like isoform X2 [Hyposmocoma kahamanoa]|nr:uridine diphosphate glucose pyrophosphatase-like isoform X2 [Hyposmocoma kahamanoa]
MEDLKNVSFSPLPDTTYVRPFRFNYTQNGQSKSWDLLEVHDSVAIIIFNVERKKLVFVKQFRPAVYFNSLEPEDRDVDVVDTDKYPAALGVTLELCAGIVDKDKPLVEIAREEVLEECGYHVKLSDLELVNSYRSGVGVQGSKQTLYYCEVNDDMKQSAGGGVDDEIIDLVEMSISQVEKMLFSPSAESIRSPPSCLYGLMWFLHTKAPKYRK